MKPSISHLACLGLLLLPLTIVPSRPVQAGAKSISSSISLTHSAPALVQDSAESLRRALLARLEFEELNLQLAGVARFNEQAACTIKHPGSPEPMLYRAGDVIGGYRIIAIDQTSVTFERNDLKFYLTAGEASNGSNILGSDALTFDSPEKGQLVPTIVTSNPSASASNAATRPAAPAIVLGPALDPIAEHEAIALKMAGDDLKQKTSRFDSAQLIEEVTAGDRDENQAQSSSGRGSRFAMPLPQSRFTSGFGYRRHPLGGGIRFHRGIDLAAPFGTPIHSAASGIIEKSGWTPTIGNYVTINHGNGYTTRYGHMSRRLARVGDRVNLGDVIGRVGSTGESTGNHLHFEIRKNDVALDPEAFVKVSHFSLKFAEDGED